MIWLAVVLGVVQFVAARKPKSKLLFRRGEIAYKSNEIVIAVSVQAGIASVEAAIPRQLQHSRIMPPE